MSLITCPECGHEISTNALACPNCGYTFARVKPILTRTVVENNTTESIPKWVIIPVVTVAALIIIVIFVMMRNNGDNANVGNVNVTMAKTQNTPLNRETTVKTVESNPPSQVTVPSNPTTVYPPSQPVTSVPTSAPASQQTVPSNPAAQVKQPDPNKGSVKIDAKVSAKNGSVQSVKNEKFYLLDEDVETILNKADLEPIESNSLTNSFGLSIMYPERYSEFNRKALEAIKKHIKYSGLTDAAGKASINDVKTDSYYLFGITKSKTGFAFWNSPVSVNSGENLLNLSPASFNEISE